MYLDTPSPEQVIAVPKISSSSRCSRTVLRDPQTAEQLVEVPTVVSFSSLQQQTVEQIIDIPVPRTRGDRGGPRGFSPGQGSSQRTVEQIVDIPAGGGLQDFLPDPWLSASSAVSRDEAFQRVFRTFPRVQKSARSAKWSSAREHGHSSSWTSSARTSGWGFPLGVVTLGRSSITLMGLGRAPYGGLHGSCDGGVGRGGCWRFWDHAAQVLAVLRVHHRASDFVHRQSAGHFSRYTQCQTVQGTVPGAGDRAEPGSIAIRQSTVAFKRISFPGSLARAVRTWNVGALFPCGLVFGSHASCVWVLHVQCSELDSSGNSAVTRAQCLTRQWRHVLHQCLALVDELHTFSTAKWTRILRCSVFSLGIVLDSVLTQNGEVCSADASVYSPGMRCSHLEIWKFLLRGSRGWQRV